MINSTKNTITNFKKSRNNRYFSQSGEDGLLEFILEKIPAKDSWCCEFGAWDGKHLSNTYHFITKLNYNSVLIEGDSKKHSELCANMSEFNSICINEMVGFKGESTLDSILSKTPIPKDFDLLSIDIDGDDFHVWNALNNYSPKVIIIEINIRDKPNVDRINISGSPVQWGVTGTSIKSMTELAVRKGYSLIAHAGCNVIYVRNQYYSLFFKEPMNPVDLFTYEGHRYDELTKQEIAASALWLPSWGWFFSSQLRPRHPIRAFAKKMVYAIKSL